MGAQWRSATTVASEVVERVLGPLGLVLKGGIWYVIALADGQIRTYRASRVVAATILDEPVDRPEGFDLAAYWAESSAAYEREAPTVLIEVRVREDQQWRINQVFGRGTVAAAERVDEDDHAGTVAASLAPRLSGRGARHAAGRRPQPGGHRTT